MVVLLLWTLPPLQSQERQGSTLLAAPGRLVGHCQLPRITFMARLFVLTSFQACQQMVRPPDVARTWHHRFSSRHYLPPDI